MSAQVHVSWRRRRTSTRSRAPRRCSRTSSCCSRTCSRTTCARPSSDTQLALDAANVLQGRGEGLTALGALAGCCMMMAGPVGTPVRGRRLRPQVYSQTMALYNEPKKAGGEWRTRSSRR